MAFAVLDASAVLAWLLHEDGYETVAKLLPASAVPASAVVETIYRALEKGRRDSPKQLHDAIISIGASIEPLTDVDTIRAGELIYLSRIASLKTGGKSLSLGDGLCIATAERLGLPVVGGDEHWKSVKMSIKFRSFKELGKR
jgi:ribonuclease VapC